MENVARPKISEKDLKILRVLRKDARSTIRGISKKTDIRPSTVHQRMTKMIDRNVIKRFTVEVDEELLGFDLTVFMLVSGTLDRYLDTEILKKDNVMEVSGITGEYDLLLKLKFRNMKEFNDFVIEFREKYSEKIHKTVTMVQTISLKTEGLPI